MTVKVLFFAGLREALGAVAETLDLPDGVATVGDLRDHAGRARRALAGAGSDEESARRGEPADGRFDAAVKAGDEVAFFPPVTGG
jgi:molybdopterin synthase sulfur carrier subunit